tara:strand:+ start:629 stop:811 length:183 start_codon:yes stop_codon:yes gene_type:complete
MNKKDLLKKIEELEEKIITQDKNLIKLTSAIPTVIKSVCFKILKDTGLLVQLSKKQNKNE